MINFSDLKVGIQIVSLIFSIFFNVVLIYLIVKKSPKKLGTYKHLMCYFSAWSIIYAILDWIVKPYIHSYGASFSMIMDLRGHVLHDNPTIAFFFVDSLAGCFGVSIYSIAINFIFRFFALERKGRLRYFKGKYLLIWFLIPLLAGLSWVLVCWILLSPNLVFTEYLRADIKEDYGLEADHITYIGALYYKTYTNGSLQWNISKSIGAFGLNVIMVVPFLTIVVMGWKSYKTVTNLLSQGENEYSKRLQMQLYKALVAQTIIPMTFLFLPIGLHFTAPLLHLNIEKFSAAVTFFFSLYPAIDPIPIIFFIDNYRNSFLYYLKKPSQTSPKVHASSDVAQN